MFTVVAGKYEADGSRNYKYIESFDTRQEAEDAWARVAGYPFAEIEAGEYEDARPDPEQVAQVQAMLDGLAARVE